VLSVIRVDTLDDAIDLVNRCPIGNATAIFTSSGKAVREYSSRIEVFRLLRTQFGARL
jgi:malonate-semialdehyde dehydrogenase (acetylating)/methylmalonate-semialdehyde dehydrogenase